MHNRHEQRAATAQTKKLHLIFLFLVGLSVSWAGCPLGSSNDKSGSDADTDVDTDTDTDTDTGNSNICTTDQDCPDGYWCNGGFCEQGKGDADTDADVDTDADTDTDTDTDTGTGTDTSAQNRSEGDPCDDQNKCMTGLICYSDGICHRGCFPDKDPTGCEDGEVCDPYGLYGACILAEKRDVDEECDMTHPCKEGLSCVHWPGTLGYCCKPCSDGDSNQCDYGHFCYPTEFKGGEPAGWACARPPEGDLKVGEKCYNDQDHMAKEYYCEPGSMCVGPTQDDITCMKMCHQGSTDECSDGETCVPLSGVDHTGVCAEGIGGVSCDLMKQDCPDGQMCNPTQTGGICVDVGNSDFGQTCEVPGEKNCKMGHLCVNFQGASGPACFETCEDGQCSQQFWNCVQVGDGTNNVPICIATCNVSTMLCDQIGWNCVEVQPGSKICLP